MSQTAARVEDIDALKAFKSCLWKFAEAASTALSESDAEIQRTMVWLETEQRQFWETQVRKCHEAVNRAKDAVRQKKLYKDASGRTPSAVDEEKALRIALRRQEEAEQRAANTKRYTRQLQKEFVLYKGQIQRFATSVENDLPVAVTHLTSMVEALEAYLALAMQAGGPPPMAGSELAPQAATTDVASADAAERAALEAAELRRRTPQMDARAVAPLLIDRVAWKVDSVTDAQRQALAEADIRPVLVEPASRITIGEGCWSASRVYLEHAPAASAEDSGWYVGPADDTLAGGPRYLRVMDLLELRPDWSDLLCLPSGFVAVLGAAGLAAVYDSDNRNVLTA